MRWRIDLSSTNPRQMEREAQKYVGKLGRAALFASDSVAMAGRQAIRSRMQASNLGRFRSVVQFTSDQKKGRLRATHFQPGRRWRAGAAVFTNFKKSPRAAGAWDAYTTGPMIVPKRGKWLAIPTDNVPKRAGRRKMTPELYNSSGAAAGPLKFVPGPRPNVAYLIAENVTVPGSNKGGVARGAGQRRVPSRVRRDFVVMFILIRRTKREVRFRPVEIVKQEALKMPKILSDYMNRTPSGPGSGSIRTPVIARSGGTFRQ